MKNILFIVVLLGLSCSLFGWGFEFYNDFNDMQRTLTSLVYNLDNCIMSWENKLDKNGIFESLEASRSLSLLMTCPSNSGKCWIGRGIYSNELVGKEWFTFYHAVFDKKDSLIMQIKWAGFLIYRDSDFYTAYCNRRKTTFTFNKKKVGKDVYFGSNEEKKLNDYYWTHKLLRFEDPGGLAFGVGFIIEVVSKDKKGIQRFLKMYESFSVGSDSVVTCNMKPFGLRP